MQSIRNRMREEVTRDHYDFEHVQDNVKKIQEKKYNNVLCKKK